MMKKNPFLGYGGGDTFKFQQVADAWARRPKSIRDAEREARERQARDYQEALAAVRGAVTPQIDAETLAAQIVRAAAKARREVDDIPPLDPTSTAAKILRAGRVRRGEETAEDQAEQARKMSPTALAIVNSGRRRRGEPEIK
jgi:hypothetical protein